ncbi:hypothetical protein [Streptomyces subrutilus]|uniref:DUF4307 domain-containing protein n=1 Tax=Streptomyces subrutilus TaxID=36818 RepID=A0A1E5PV56_9ACTN|nr:hypothetical protein [Streptomyces subrutilus]OEJ33478.1 hypothetical protein BGK67_20995 [Streptomyces subrutilus]
MGVSTGALKWQGWLVGLVTLAGLLVFAPLGLYVWASGGPSPHEAVEVDPRARVTACRVDPASRRVVATVELTGRGSYVVTVEFRDREHPGPATRAAQSLVKIPGVLPGAAERADAIGPVWPAATILWCGIAHTEPAATAEPEPS